MSAAVANIGVKLPKAEKYPHSTVLSFDGENLLHRSIEV